MSTLNSTIQRQYDEVIAHNYDNDPQRVAGRCLDCAFEQIRNEGVLKESGVEINVCDLGMGTGNFLAKLKKLAPSISPFGIDFSEKMVEIARRRLPDLQAEVDDVNKLDVHFPGKQFQLICSHFITGFVPLEAIAPKVFERLAPGGYWSIVGGTMQGFPAIHRASKSWVVRNLLGKKSAVPDQLVCNPKDFGAILDMLKSNGFSVRKQEPMQPDVEFRSFDDFLKFAYYGGWLTPFIEDNGIHKAGRVTRAILNATVFPTRDHHDVGIILARKP